MLESLIVSVLLLLICLLVLPGTGYLLLLTLAGWRNPTVPESSKPWLGRIAIVVPAHNEAPGIGRTVANLQAIAGRDGHAEVCVVADNCSDGTAAEARANGARVLERVNPELRGKGYALDYAFSSLATAGFDAYLVIDADTLAAPNLLSVLRQYFSAGADAVQVRYAVLNADDSPRNRLVGLALCAFNSLRPRGRAALGWSAGILGNGFALRHEVLARVPYTATSVVEDLEYHLRLIEADVRVHFADQTVVRGEMPVAQRGQRQQRARWEGGRLRMLLEQGPRLLQKAWHGQPRFLEPLLDLLLLPLAYHSLLLLILACVPHPLALPLSLFGLATLGLHLVAAARVGGIPMTKLCRILSQVPAYLIWKVGMLNATIQASNPAARWVRSDRSHES